MGATGRVLNLNPSVILSIAKEWRGSLLTDRQSLCPRQKTRRLILAPLRMTSGDKIIDSVTLRHDVPLSFWSWSLSHIHLDDEGLDGVVAVAEAVPGGLVGLGVAQGVGGAGAQRVAAGAGGVQEKRHCCQV